MSFVVNQLSRGRTDIIGGRFQIEFRSHCRVLFTAFLRVIVLLAHFLMYTLLNIR